MKPVAKRLSSQLTQWHHFAMIDATLQTKADRNPKKNSRRN
jgi:hypothetical protein